MTALERFARPRLSLTVAGVLAALGLVAFQTMPRQEDPTMLDRWALVVVPFPGADVETIERLVLRPIEQELAEVDDLGTVRATARSGLALLNLELRDAVDAARVETAWEDVEQGLARARRELPAAAGEPVLDRKTNDPESILLAVTGPRTPQQMLPAARRLERELLGLPGMSRVLITGDPGEQVGVEYDAEVARQLGVSPAALAGLLAERHVTLPAGSVELGGRIATLRPGAELRSVEEIAALPVPLPSGNAVPLSELARVQLEPRDPPEPRVRVGGEAAVVLGLVPARDIDLVAFGAAVRARVAELAPSLQPLHVEEVAFQPDRVESRLSDLGQSLWLGVITVGAILLLFMGVRLGLVVSAVVLLVSFASIGMYAAVGGVLHQMSIAALLIALGTFIDNAIVVVEAAQAKVDAGETPRAASLAAARELAVPLASATLTNIAAFVPMLLAEGPTAEFTRALPVVIILTLTVSYGFAVLATPALAAFLRPLQQQRAGSQLGERLSGFAVRRPGLVLSLAALLVVASLLPAGQVRQQFFPAADRAQLLVDVELPEGAALAATDAVTARLEAALLGHPQVRRVTAFVGRGAPHFYYNVAPRPGAPHLAQLLVDVRDLESVAEVRDWVRELAHAHLPAASVIARRLEQGPWVPAPVEVRVLSEDPEALQATLERVRALVRRTPGARDVRDDLGTGAPAIELALDDAGAARHGVSRADLVRSLLGQTRGLPVGQLQSGDALVPIVVRSGAGSRTPPDALASLDVTPSGGVPVPLGQLAEARASLQAGVILHHDRRRSGSVLAELEEGVVVGDVLRVLAPALDRLALPPGVRLELGGAGEGASESNRAMLAALPLGLALLLGTLLWEFDSYRRVAIVFSTVPLSAVGVVPGLLLAGQPFGFMSMLGVIALAGIVVNNAIVLLDAVERQREAGVSVVDAVRASVRERLRPILLTTVTTVAGLLPLAFSDTTLWPPLAWAIVSGLIASTALTLLVVPALYVVLVRDPGPAGT